MIKKTFLLAFIVSSSVFASSDPCYNYTVSQAGNLYSPLKQKINGSPVGKFICSPTEYQHKISDDLTCRVTSTLITVSLTAPNPEDNLKCVNVYINPFIKKESLYIENLLNDTSFINNSGMLTNTDINRDYQNTFSDIYSKKRALSNTKSDLVKKITQAHKNNSLNTIQEKSKINFLNSFIDTDVFNVNRYFKDMSKIKDPINIKTKTKTSEANKVFKECAEATQKIPSFNIEDMLEGIKDEIFDLSGQITDMATNLTKNIKDSIMEATSDEAVFTYSLQGIAKLSAMIICKSRSAIGSGDVKTTVSAQLGDVAAKKAKDEANTNQENSTTRTSKETSCWLGIWGGSCLIKAPAGFKVAEDSLTGESSDEDKKAADMKKAATDKETYKSCMEEEPNKVMRYMLKMINTTVKGGKVEFDTLEECNDEEYKKSFEHKNAFDKAGQPTRNRISDFLNTSVDFLQNNRDGMLSSLEDSLTTTELKDAVKNNPKKPEDLFKEIKTNFISEDFGKIYPNINLELFDSYVDSFYAFIPFIQQENIDLNIESSLYLLISPELNSDSHFKVSKDYIEIIGNSNNFLYRYLASLPAYDYYMNFFLGEDLTGFNSSNGNDPIKNMANSYSDKPRTLAQVLNTNNTVINGISEKSEIIKNIMIDSMNDYYTIWSNLLNYFTNDFSFNYTIINGRVSYIINIDEIKKILDKEFNIIYNKPRYLGKLDSNGKELEGFSVQFVKDRLEELDSKITSLLNSSNSKSQQEITPLIEEYTKYLLDYNLYLSIYDINNDYSLLSLIDDTNILLQSNFINMNGYEIEKTQDMFRKFIQFSNLNNH